MDLLAPLPFCMKTGGEHAEVRHRARDHRRAGATAAERGIDVVDVEVVGATKAPCVRVRIDHADESAPTITLDEVTEETEWISAALDELDPIPSSFTLEVSSPGMARPLRRERDFARFAGETVQLSLVPGEGGVATPARSSASRTASSPSRSTASAWSSRLAASGSARSNPTSPRREREKSEKSERNPHGI